jgi:hypothetical protein
MSLRPKNRAFGKSNFKVQDKEPVASAFSFGIGLTFTLPVDESVEISMN